jgi:hypothetical protein
MLTGKPALIGESISDTLAAVIRAEPDWASLRANTPPAIRTLLHRCLQKDPRQRLQAIGEARITIEGTLAGVTETELMQPTGPSRWLRARALALVGLGLLLGVILASLIFWGYHGPTAPKAVSRLSLLLPAGDSVDPGGPIALSPDGSAVIYNARHGTTSRLYLRSMDRFESTSLPGAESGYIPFFSPDGQWIGFFAGGKLKKVSVNGGQAVTLCEAPTPRGASWGPDDTIVFTPTLRMSSLMRIPAAGGTAEKLTQLNTDLKEVTHRWPEILPGGKALVFVIGEAKDIGTMAKRAGGNVGGPRTGGARWSQVRWPINRLRLPRAGGRPRLHTRHLQEHFQDALHVAR